MFGFIAMTCKHCIKVHSPSVLYESDLNYKTPGASSAWFNNPTFYRYVGVTSHSQLICVQSDSEGNGLVYHASAQVEVLKCVSKNV